MIKPADRLAFYATALFARRRGHKLSTATKNVELDVIEEDRREVEQPLIDAASKLFIEQGREVVKNVDNLKSLRHDVAARLELASWAEQIRRTIPGSDVYDPTAPVVKAEALTVVLKLFDLGKWRKRTEDIFRRLLPVPQERGFEVGSVRVGATGTNFQADNERAKRTLRLTLSKVVGTCDETVRLMALVVDDWLKAEGTNEDLAQALHDKFAQYSIGRAGRIGRTANVAMFEGGQLQAWEEAEVARKTWLSRRDENVRRSPYNHNAADGETVDVGKPFTKTGQKLMHPADPAGAPGNVVECRCSMIPELDEDDEE